MERWNQKVAIVTGCTSGIGEAITRHLCGKGMTVIGLARRLDRLESLQTQLAVENHQFVFHQCDVSNKFSVKTVFARISQTVPNVSVLVNSAGVNISMTILEDGNEDALESVINTNLMGSLYCIKEAYKLMKIEGEHYFIININSILGHKVVRTSRDLKLNMYPASKFGLRAASEVLRLELLDDKRFHISNISPGLVSTEMTEAAKDYVATQPTLHPEDIARSVDFILSMDSHVQIADIIIKPVGEKI